ncbi:hypothetical protein BKK39_03675 [Bacillus cereus]|uniref:hypothetical protein n=1 Tax=Bacillus cereus group TaxID=86661 RepID=UPI00094240CB|nr:MULTISPECIES: hypothetical protein [Bacillus cereus group]ONG79366.1 hypothetical protein BKK41_20660 [Bacillus cereus]MDA1986249.1 hypothetical protein [Bacillus cereus group sp. BcHK104]MDA2238581.1 hypothetical protein [Bacillus cereus group sp. Bc222]MDA2584021.1 hypothetical protein [Bacillus cereus group sp. Bc062]MDX6044468.1 hypothetical protein [Bacillus paranthracis]
MLWQTEVSVLNKKLFSIIILLVVAILSPYNLFKKIYFIIGVLIIGAISLGTNKFFELVHSKFNKK